MKPVFVSPSLQQTKELEAILRQAGIDVSMVEKKNQQSLEKTGWCELWLKQVSDSDKANSIITQHEFRTLKQLLSCQSVSAPKQECIPEKPELRQTMEQAHLPINNQRVFRRLAILLGFSEEESKHADFNKVYRPWSNKSLMERVKILQQVCISTNQSPADNKKH